MDLHISPEDLVPGESCSISVNTSSKSIVSIVALDQQALNGRALDMAFLNPNVDHKLLQYPRDASEMLNLIDSINTNTFILTDTKTTTKSCASSSLGVDSEADDEEIDSIQESLDDHLMSSWFFETLKVDKKGLAILEKTVPNSITTYTVAGVAISPGGVLTLSKQHQLKVSKNFYVSFDLPHLTRLKEMIKIEVFVMNGQPEAINVDVALHRNENNEEDFEYIQKISECSILSDDRETEQHQQLSVSPNTIEMVSFIIRPLKTGQIRIKVKATIEDHDDFYEVVKDLNVAKEGFTVYRDDQYIIDPSVNASDPEAPMYNSAFDLAIPEGALANSIHIEGLVITELLSANLLDARKIM